jgi:hypothetical protein
VPLFYNGQGGGGLFYTGAPQPQTPQPNKPQKKLSLLDTLLHVAGNPIGSAENAIGKYIAPQAARGVNFVGSQVAGGINRLDHNASLPVIGNVGNAVGSLISAPAVTIQHTGKILQGQNPYQGMAPLQAAGSFGVDALNALTLGKGGPLAKVGENIAGKATAKIGSQVAKKAIGNTIKTTATTLPITAGYGAAGTLASGDTNPNHVLQNTLLGAAAAPVMGLAHGAMPLVGAGAKGATKAGVKALPATTVHADFTPTPDLKTPKGINDHINYIKSQLDAMPDRLKEVQAKIENTPEITPARKQTLLQQATNDINTEANALKGEMASHIQTLTDMGRNHIPEASIPQGLAEAPAAPKGSAYAGPNSHIINPTLGQKVAGIAKQVAEPFMNPNPESASMMGILRDQHGYIGQPRDLVGKFSKGKSSNSPKIPDSSKPIKVYHVTSAANKEAILKNGFKPGSELPEEAFRGGGHGQMQHSISFADNVKDASRFGISQRNTLIEAELKPTAKVIDRMDIEFAEDMNDEVPQLLKQGVDAVRIGSGEGEIVVINPKAISKINGTHDFKGVEANDLHKVYKPQESDPKSSLKSLLNNERGSNGLPIINGTTKMAKGGTPVVKENSLTKGAKEGRQNVSDSVSELASGVHVQRNTAKLGEDAAAQAKKLSSDDLIQQAHDRVAVPDGKIDDKDAAFVIQAIERADKEGRLDDATALHDALSNHVLKTGQTSQAASLLYTRTPQGLLFKALKDLKKAGVEVTPELQTKLKGLIEELKAQEKGTDASRKAIAKFQKEVGNQLPQKFLNNVTSVWKAGLLSGVKTQGGNALSNATFGALKKVSDVPATLADQLISIKTGNRTKTMTFKGIGGGTVQGVKKGASTLKTGIDERDIVNDKYEVPSEIQFKNKIAQGVFGKPANFVFRGMSAGDQPFYYAALKNSINDQAKAAGLNQDLLGKDLAAFMRKQVAKPSDAIYNQAVLDAKKAVLGEDSNVASKVSALAAALPGGKVLVPFVKVPTNFLKQTLDYTPVGVATQAVKQIGSHTFDQRALSEAIGKGITGTGVIYLGATLANSGQLSGDFPTDAKEQARWKAEHITPNSVKLGNKWVSLNYLGPIGLLFNAGKNLHEAQVAGNNQVLAAAAGLGKGLLGQSFIQGFSGFSDAIKDPQRNMASFVNSEIASVIPAWSNDIGNMTDSWQRKANSPLEAAQARIPGKRNELAVKKDSFGNPLPQASGGLNAAINPLKPSDAKTTPLLTELDRLKTTGSDNTVFRTDAKTISAGNQTIKLTPAQQDAYNTAPRPSYAEYVG